jgi:hypothetical protein
MNAIQSNEEEAWIFLKEALENVTSQPAELDDEHFKIQTHHLKDALAKAVEVLTKSTFSHNQHSQQALAYALGGVDANHKNDAQGAFQHVLSSVRNSFHELDKLRPQMFPHREPLSGRQQ